MERTVTFDDEEWQLVPRKPSPAMLGKGLSVTARWLELSGSALTVNYKKMSIRQYHPICAPNTATLPTEIAARRIEDQSPLELLE